MAPPAAVRSELPPEWWHDAVCAWHGNALTTLLVEGDAEIAALEAQLRNVEDRADARLGC